MTQTAEAFLRAPRKALTFLGMSGVGKTYLSALLEEWGWTRYSCDYEIGVRYLKEALGRVLETPDDIGALSAFIGQLGNPALGGLPLEEFQRRQKLYYEAECSAIAGVSSALEQAHGNFVHDSTGSLCEITDEALIARLGGQTLFVYLKASPEEERAVLERARTHPKPLFFPPAQFMAWVSAYLSAQGLEKTEEIVPDEFSRWVFPRLFESRLPKYQALADRYGVTISTADLRDLRDEQDFITRIAQRLAR